MLSLSPQPREGEQFAQDTQPASGLQAHNIILGVLGKPTVSLRHQAMNQRNANSIGPPRVTASQQLCEEVGSEKELVT